MLNQDDLKNLVEELIEKGPKEMDLTDDHHAKSVIEGADQFLKWELSPGDILEIEKELLQSNEDSLIFILLILKIVRSRLLVKKLKTPLKVSIVFAVYKEHNRIRSRSEHPHGENFLVKKVEQLKWLFAENEQIDWELIVVDDGCPEKSGEIANTIIEENQLQSYARVLFLADAIEQGIGTAKDLRSTNDSQKGGSIVYGMWDAVNRKGSKDHIVSFTDADLSTHLGQLGLLMDPILTENKLAAIGSRREIDSVVIKKGARNNRGKLFIYLWKRLIPNLGDIVDTQCGFKAFDAMALSSVLQDLIEKKFAFDIELLLKTMLVRPDSIYKVGIAWIDSEAASTTTDIQPYLPMLKSIAAMYRKYFDPDDEREDFANFINGLTEEEFLDLLDHIPNDILVREPLEFTEFDQVKVDELQTSIRK